MPSEDVQRRAARFHVERCLRVVLTAILLLIAAAIAVAMGRMRASEEMHGSIDASFRVLAQVEEVLRFNVDLQTGIRGWLLSGDERYLEPSREALDALPSVLASLSAATTAQPGDSGVDGLEQRVAAHIAARERLIDIGRTSGVQAARAAVDLSDGERLLEQIRTEVGRVREWQKQLLVEQERARQAADRNALATVALLGALIVVIVLTGHYIVWRNLSALRSAQRARAGSDRRLAVTLASIGDAVITTDVRGRIERVNAEAERLMGCTEAEALGRPAEEVFALLDSESGQRLADPVTEVLASGRSSSAAGRVLLAARAGTRTPVTLSVCPIQTAGGPSMGTVIVCRDATEDEQMALAIARVRSQLEQRVHERTAELEAVNAKLRLVEFTVQQAPVATYWIARDARILRVNATACRMLGYRAEDLEQMPLASLDPAFPFERWEQSWDELRRVGHRTIETVHIALDGRHLPVEVDVCHLEFEGAEYHVAFARDISQRKLTESSLRASEERFRGTLDAMLEGCMIIGFDWRYRYVNEAAARHAGSTVDEVRSRSVFEVAPGIDQTSLFAVMRDCMDKRRSAKVEHEVRFAGGPTRWFELAIQAAPEGLFVLSLDITDRKRGAAAVPPNTAAIANRCRNRAGAPRAAPRYGWRR